MEDDLDLEKMPRWRLPKSVAPDAWLYYTRRGIEVYHDGSVVCVIPQRYVAMYAKQRAALTRSSPQQRSRKWGGHNWTTTAGPKKKTIAAWLSGLKLKPGHR